MSVKVLAFFGIFCGLSLAATKPATAVWQSGNSLASGCLRYWFIDSSTSTVIDYSPSGANLTVAVAPTLVTAPGGVGNEYGTTGSVGIGVDTGLPSGTNPWSVAAWIKTTSTSGEFIIVGWGAILSGNNRVIAEQNATFLDAQNSGGGPHSTSTWNDGNWHRLVITWDGSATVIYVDGTSNGSGAQGFNTTLTSVMAFGATGVPSVDWNGSIGDIAIWNRALSSVDVTSDFADPWQEVRSTAMSITPAAIPKSHAGNIVLSLTGIGTSWVNGTTVMTASGVSGTSCGTVTVTSSTAATVTCTTGSTTGTLTITESVTGTTAGTATVGTGSFTISPTSGILNATPSITFTGTNTVWNQETAAGLFTLSGGTSASIGTPTCTTATACTATLTTGSAVATLTLTDSVDSATATFSVLPVVSFPNSNIYLSPYTWRIFSGSIDAPTGGAYIKGVVSGTTQILANVDTSGNSAQTSNGMPSFRVTIDDGPSTYVQEATSATQVTLATSLTTSSHRYLIQVLGASTAVGNSWTATASHTVITSLQFDSGFSLSPPTTKSKICLFFGDSYLSTYYGATQTGAWYTYIDYTSSWPGWVAAALGCEYGQEGIGSSGWQQPGNGGFPSFTSWWGYYDSTHVRDLTTIPNYLIVAIGVNDHVGTWSTAQINTAMNSFHSGIRGTSGWATVPLFVILPFADVSDAVNHAQIAASLAAWADPNAHLIDIGTELQACLPFIGGVTWCSNDGLHPTLPYHGWIAASVMKLMQATIGANAPGPITAQ